MHLDLKKYDGIDYLQVLNNPILPTAYLAPIEYYAILLKYTDCSIEHYENFIKQTIRNRCNIYGSNGKLLLTIPKKRKQSNKTIIKDLKISYAEDWQKKHWDSITSSYNSSPFFEYYRDDLKKLYQFKEIYLINFNRKIQNTILQLLEKNCTIKKTAKYKKDGAFSDLRDYTFEKCTLLSYQQVFIDKHGFIPHLSILDLIFNLGPESTQYLQNIPI